MGLVSISIHKNYSGYVEFVRKLEREWGQHLSKLDSFTVSLKSDIIVIPFTFKHLHEYIRKG